jgi:hypothetical protein
MDKETEYNQSIDKCRELLSKIKTLNVLADIKSELITLRDRINLYSGDEYEYYCNKTAIETFEKSIQVIDDQIIKLKQD